MPDPKYPAVIVVLSGTDGNAFAILGLMAHALRSHGLREEEVCDFMREAENGDYGHLLLTCMAWVDVR